LLNALLNRKPTSPENALISAYRSRLEYENARHGKAGYPPALLGSYELAKRLTFNPMSMQEPKGREVVLKAADYLAKNRVLEKPITPEFLG
jgi:hypothetical protein